MQNKLEARVIEQIQDEFESLKLTDIRVFDRRGLSSLADFYLLASADSLSQVEAARVRLIRLMKEHGYTHRNPNESYRGGWLILDFSDLVVNVFTEETRAFYNLDHFLETGEIDIENITNPVHV